MEAEDEGVDYEVEDEVEEVTMTPISRVRFELPVNCQCTCRSELEPSVLSKHRLGLFVVDGGGKRGPQDQRSRW